MRKILSLIFVFVILSLCVLPVTAIAEENDWWISEDNLTVKNGNTVYTKYELSRDVDYLPSGKILLYPLEHEDSDYTYDYIAVPDNTTDIVCRHYTGEIYVTEKGREILKNFESYNFSSYYLMFGEVAIDIIETDFDLFMKDEMLTQLDVTKLADDNLLAVYGFDQTETVAHTIGEVYFFENDYYYIHYDALDNSYFDAYGNFSFRKGVVPAYKLDKTGVDMVINAQASDKYRTVEYIYTDENPFIEEDDKFSASLTFWTISIIVGFIIPMVPLVLSVVYANSTKAGKPKRWYLLTLTSVLWILTSVGIIINIVL